MQIRESQFKGCPWHHKRESNCLHEHGNYERHHPTRQDAQISIRRLFCVAVCRTISILPDDMFPYRGMSVSKVETCFDWLSGLSRQFDPPDRLPRTKVGSKNRLAINAWENYAGKVPKPKKTPTPRWKALREFFGLQIRETKDPIELWRALRQDLALNVRDILEQMAAQRKSLLGDYQCLGYVWGTVTRGQPPQQKG